jgi:hypothetical protein
MVCLEGTADAGVIHLDTRDALEITKQDVTLSTKDGCHLFVIEMPYDKGEAE